MSSQAEIYELKARFQLTEGKFDDFYQLHKTWCVTKGGAHKIAKAAGIKMEVIHCDILPIAIAYRGLFTFTPEGGEPISIHEIGSCRFDGSNNTPERTHAPEMAWKRLFVRGVLALVAPGSGIYGADEMTSDWHKHGNSAPSPASPPPPQQRQQQAPLQRPEDLHPSIQQAPAQKQAAPVSSDNPAWVAKLPQEWNMVMGKIAENSHMARSEFELPILNHVTKRQYKDKWYDAATQWGSFEAFINGRTKPTTEQPNGWPLYNKALDAKKKIDALASDLATGREVVLQYNSDGVLMTMTIAPRAENGPPRSSEPTAMADSFPDDIPF